MSCRKCAKWESKEWVVKKFGVGKGICHYKNEVVSGDYKGCPAGDRFKADYSNTIKNTYMNLPIGTKIKIVSGICEGSICTIVSEVKKSASGVDVYCYRDDDNGLGVVPVEELMLGEFMVVLDEDNGDTTDLEDYSGGTIFLD